MSEQSNVLEIHEQVSAYFDGELEDSACALVEAQLEQDPELAARLADLSFMREMVVGDLEYQAERVPDARFEQIWDNFELALERESRLQEAAEAPPSLWERFSTWVRPLRMPLSAVAAAGALVFVFAKSAGAPSDVVAEVVADTDVAAANTQDEPASDAEPQPDAPEAARPVEVQPIPQTDQLAVAPVPAPEDPEMFPPIVPGEADIRHIEFGGHMGTIAQLEGARGTTTVIWVTEDEGPVDSERSL